MLILDGSAGEGGGQILRSALTLSLATGRPFRIERIRAKRKRPGLMRQHLTAVKAAQAVSSAEVEGAEVGSMALSFRPGVLLGSAVGGGEFSFAIGTAGSTTLVLQTLLPALMLASQPSRLTLEGGTHNPFAPPWDFLVDTYLPLLERMGPRFRPQLDRAGFFPAGGGRVSIEIEPVARLAPLELLKVEEPRELGATVLTANLPKHVGAREAKRIQELTSLPVERIDVRELGGVAGPGNAVMVKLKSPTVTEVFSTFGQQGVRAEAVAEQAVRDYRRFLAANVPVGEHLADQLLLPMALAGQGSFRTLPLSRHALTQIEVLAKFLEVEIATRSEGGAVVVAVGGPTARDRTGISAF